VQVFKPYRLYFLFAFCLVVFAMLTNSCKKDNSDNVTYFLTAGTWRLASVTRISYVGDTLKKTDTLNLTCNTKQDFIFKSDNSCSYSNYHCITQTSAGKWSISSDNLSIQTTLTAQDTSKGTTVNVNAFGTAQIENLGQYSLVLRTGYTSVYYTSKTARVIYRYGFIHSIDQ
jgi:hypothetical protein